MPPINFAARNAQLIASIKKAINNSETDFADFKKVSMQYRQGAISAQSYYNEFNRICGTEAARIFPELVALLPDSVKQEQLLQVRLNEACHWLVVSISFIRSPDLS